MNIKAIHGSKANDIKTLEVRSYAHDNGCYEGIGVNLTNNPSLALSYAGKDGSIYLSSINASNFLNVSSSNKLSIAQEKILIEKLNNLDSASKYRLATDIIGKCKSKQGSPIEADIFFEEKEKEILLLGNSPERLMPEFSDIEDDLIFYSHDDFTGIGNVSTKEIHDALMMWDNYRGTEILSSVCEGLIIDRDNGFKNYLSFSEVSTLKEYTGSLLQRDDIGKLLTRVCSTDNESELSS